MQKNGVFVIYKLVAVLLLGVTIVGCKTTQYSVEISNVPKTSISAVYIRNAGATDWGNNVVANLSNIDRTRYSQTVDIRVVDTNGVVYSKYNIPFDDVSFVETGKKSSLNIYAMSAIAVPLLVLGIVFLSRKGGSK